MVKNSIKEAELKLSALKKETDNKIWQCIIIKEMVNLFNENRRVLEFIMANYGAPFYGIMDDRFSLSKEELEAYEQNRELSLDEQLCYFFDMKSDGE